MNILIQFFLLFAQIPAVLECNSCKNLQEKHVRNKLAFCFLLEYIQEFAMLLSEPYSQNTYSMPAT